MNYKTSYLTKFMLDCQELFDKSKLGKWKPKSWLGQLIMVMIAFISFLLVCLMCMIILLIETPILIIVFKGSFKDKMKHWLRGWKSLYIWG